MDFWESEIGGCFFYFELAAIDKIASKFHIHCNASWSGQTANDFDRLNWKIIKSNFVSNNRYEISKEEEEEA